MQPATAENYYSYPEVNFSDSDLEFLGETNAFAIK